MCHAVARLNINCEGSCGFMLNVAFVDANHDVVACLGVGCASEQRLEHSTLTTVQTHVGRYIYRLLEFVSCCCGSVGEERQAAGSRAAAGMAPVRERGHEVFT